MKRGGVFDKPNFLCGTRIPMNQTFKNTKKRSFCSETPNNVDILEISQMKKKKNQGLGLCARAKFRHFHVKPSETVLIAVVVGKLLFSEFFLPNNPYEWVSQKLVYSLSENLALAQSPNPWFYHFIQCYRTIYSKLQI